jgi:hypothetical protein
LVRVAPAVAVSAVEIASPSLMVTWAELPLMIAVSFSPGTPVAPVEANPNTIERTSAAAIKISRGGLSWR